VPEPSAGSVKPEVEFRARAESGAPEPSAALVELEAEPLPGLAEAAAVVER
jgi:hypothetical protein